MSTLEKAEMEVIKKDKLPGETTNINAEEIKVLGQKFSEEGKPIEALKQAKPVKTKRVIPPEEQLYRFKEMLNKLQMAKASVTHTMAHIFKNKYGDKDIETLLKLGKEANAHLKELKNDCKENSDIAVDLQTETNSHGGLFVGIKRKIPLQKEIHQPPMKLFRDVTDPLSAPVSKHATIDSSKLYLKEKASLAKLLNKTEKEPKKPLKELNKVLKDWNELHMNIETPCAVSISSSTVSLAHQAIDIIIPGIFKVIVLIKDEPELNRRRVLKINFYSNTETTRDFEESVTLTYRALTQIAIKQMPYPINVPNSYSPVYSDPVPHLLDWIYSLNDLFELPCSKCKKVMAFSPNKNYGFLPPLMRYYNRKESSFVPFHPMCYPY